MPIVSFSIHQMQGIAQCIFQWAFTGVRKYTRKSNGGNKFSIVFQKARCYNFSCRTGNVLNKKKDKDKET